MAWAGTTYTKETVAGSPGYAYTVVADGRVVGEGWVAGPKREAMAEARRDLANWLQRKAAAA